MKAFIGALIFLTVALFCRGSHAFLLDNNFWPAGELTYDIAFSEAQFDDAFEAAAARWTSNSTVKVTVNKNSAGGVACGGTIGDKSSSVFDLDACGTARYGPTNPGSTTLAVSFSQSFSGSRVWTGITFRNDENWAVYDGPWKSGAFVGRPDFRRVATHEIGHSIGIDHADDPNASSQSQALCALPSAQRPIMCGTVGNTTAPLPDDVAAVASAYDTDSDGVGAFEDNCPPQSI